MTRRNVPLDLLGNGQIQTLLFVLSLLFTVQTFDIQIVGSRAESTLIHIYVDPTESSYIWCIPLPYGAPEPDETLIKNMAQYQLEKGVNDVILTNVISDTDYTVYCFAETSSTPPTPMSSTIGSTRTNLSTVSSSES